MSKTQAFYFFLLFIIRSSIPIYTRIHFIYISLTECYYTQWVYLFSQICYQDSTLSLQNINSQLISAGIQTSITFAKGVLSFIHFGFAIQNIHSDWTHFTYRFDFNKNEQKFFNFLNSLSLTPVVYFDQQTGAPHAVHWSKSNF